MLSDIITNVFKDSAKDIALIGGMVLLCRIASWKIKQLVGVVFSEPPSSSNKSATSRSRSSRNSHARARTTAAAVKPARNSDYYAGRKAALREAGATTASARYKNQLSRKYGKGSISHAAGYREGVKQKEWHEYVKLVRQEEEQERLELIRAQIEQKSNDHSTHNIAYRNNPMSQMRLFR